VLGKRRREMTKHLVEAEQHDLLVDARRVSERDLDVHGVARFVRHQPTRGLAAFADLLDARPDLGPLGEHLGQLRRPPLRDLARRPRLADLHVAARMSAPTPTTCARVSLMVQLGQARTARSP